MPIRTLFLAGLLIPALLWAGDDQPVLRMYDMTDLLIANSDFPAPALAAPRPVAQTPVDTTPHRAERMSGEAFIRLHFDPPVAADLITRGAFRSATWFLTAGPALHGQVEHVLTVVRNLQSRQIRIVRHAYAMDPGHRRKTYALEHLPWQAMGDQGCAAVAIAPDTARGLMDRLEQDQAVTASGQPELTVLAGQQANACSFKQYTWRQPGHDGGAAETLTMSGFTGTTMQVRATPSDDGLVMGMELEDASAAIVTILPQSAVDGRGTVTHWELPIFHVRCDRVRLVVSTGQTLLMRTSVDVDDQKRLSDGFVFLTHELLAGTAVPPAPAPPVPAPPAPPAPAAKQGADAF